MTPYDLNFNTSLLKIIADRIDPSYTADAIYLRKLAELLPQLNEQAELAKRLIAACTDAGCPDGVDVVEWVGRFGYETDAVPQPCGICEADCAAEASGYGCVISEERAAAPQTALTDAQVEKAIDAWFDYEFGSAVEAGDFSERMRRALLAAYKETP
jgi:hypothetical protein